MIPKYNKSRKSRPAFREQIQNHPFTVLTGACAAVGLIIAAVVQYHYNEKREALVREQALAIKEITKKYEDENNELKKVLPQ
jgi:hypothetical protein